MTLLQKKEAIKEMVEKKKEWIREQDCDPELVDMWKEPDLLNQLKQYPQTLSYFLTLVFNKNLTVKR